MGTKWDDLECDGRRLARLIRFLETKMKKVKDDDDSTVRYAQSIGNLISKKIEVAKFHHKVEWIEEQLKKMEKEAERRKKMFV